MKANNGSTLATAAILLLLLTGCGASTFKPYPTTISGVINGVDQSKDTFQKTVKTAIGKKAEGRDRVLYNLELGRLYQLRGNHKASIDYFRKVIEEIKARELSAKVNTKKAASQAGAVLTNDNAIPYQGYGFERIMLHQYQAMNFLAVEDLDAALVEARRAILEQKLALENHERELTKIEKQKTAEIAKKSEKEKKRAADLEKSFGEGLAEKLKAMDEITSNIKSSFQNGYAFYLSGLLNQAQGQLDNAYIDYRKAFELAPENPFVLHDVLSMAELLGRDGDYERYAKRLTIGFTKPLSRPGEGEIVVLFENGLIPPRMETKIVLPNPKLNISSIAYPYYPKREVDPIPLRIEADSFNGQTVLLSDLRILAVKNLREHAPIMATRQVLRLIAKEGIARTAEKELGIIGKIGANIFNVASENADLRSWQSLPDNVQLFRTTAGLGTHSLTLTHPGIQPTLLNLEVEPGRIMLARVTRIGHKLFTSVHSLETRSAVTLETTSFPSN